MGLNEDGLKLFPIVTRQNPRLPFDEILDRLGWDYKRLLRCVNAHKRWAVYLENNGPPGEGIQNLYVDFLDTYDHERSRKRQRTE